MYMSCGDALIDLFNQPTGSNAQGSPGEVALTGHVGGSPLNVAVGLARLGNRAAYLCKNSSDFMGQKIAAYLDANGVDMRWVLPTELNSTLAMIQTNNDGSANYAFYINGTADVSLTLEELPDDLPDELAVLNFASYSTALEPTRTALITLAQREKASRIITYDPNLRPSIEPDMAIWRESFDQFCACANFLKASDEDILALMGQGTSFDSFAADAIGNGVQVVAITEGSQGATLYSADGRQARSRPVSVQVVDTVGAGDTYQSSSLHYLNAYGHIAGNKLLAAQIDLQDMADFAATAAGITCSRRGADLPSLQDIEKARS